MKYFISAIFFCISVVPSLSQSKLKVYDLFSENGKYYLHSTPYDDWDETTFGKSYVFKTGDSVPLYSVNRYFAFRGFPNRIQISNDGKTILYASAQNYYDFEENGLYIFKNGKQSQFYSIKDLNGCDRDTIDCELLYNNDSAIARNRSSYADTLFTIGFRDNVSEEEKFANDFNVFMRNDTLYLIDQFRFVNIVSAKTGKVLKRDSLKKLYPKIHNKARNNAIKVTALKRPPYYLNLHNKIPFKIGLADYLGMSVIDNSSAKDTVYGPRGGMVELLIDQNGKAEILKIDAHRLDSTGIISFVNSSTFNVDFPKEIEKWKYKEYFTLRFKSDEEAIQDRIAWRKEQDEEYQRRLTLDSINGVYIPKDLVDCCRQFDSFLPTKDKKEMKNLDSAFEMVRYHLGLGMSIRNSWGLWGGSRLQKYFLDRAPQLHPNNMSGIILDYYYHWLQGNPPEQEEFLKQQVESYKQWEEEHRKKQEELFKKKPK
jgi:hypothetical protein